MVSELAFLFLQIEDSLFDRVFDCDFVDDNVDFLGEAMDSVDGLFFDELDRISYIMNGGLNYLQDSKMVLR